MTAIFIPCDHSKLGSEPPAIHFRLSSPPLKSPPTLSALSSRILKSMENRESKISATVSSLASRHVKISQTRTTVSESLHLASQSLSTQSSSKMDKALSNAEALLNAHVAKVAAHNASVECKALKAREAEAQRQANLAARSLRELNDAAERHAVALNGVAARASSHNDNVSARCDQVTKLRLQRLEEIKEEATERLKGAIQTHELLMLATSIRCQQHNSFVGLRFESTQAKRDARMKVLNSSLVIKVLQAELNHACVVSDIVQKCGVHSRTVAEKGSEATRLKGEKTLDLMKEQYAREVAAKEARDDHLMQLQTACGSASRAAMTRGKEATMQKGAKTCQAAIDARLRGDRAWECRVTKLSDIVKEAGEHCRGAMAKGIEAAVKRDEASRDAALANFEREQAAKAKREELIKAKVDKAAYRSSPDKRKTVSANVSPPCSPGKNEDAVFGFTLDARLDDAAARRSALLLIRSEQCGAAVARAKAVAKTVKENGGSPKKAAEEVGGGDCLADAERKCVEGGGVEDELTPMKGKRMHSSEELLPPPPSPFFSTESEEEEKCSSCALSMGSLPASSSSLVLLPPPPPSQPASRASSEGSAESWVDCGAEKAKTGGD